ncbi:hypothetical protein RFF05_17870 [Bengtsoniella intestinalis]|uniref:hypothetical protein n=1 Tax=Bengtsoniella intestinalis TaxID=3073143 RepID=UPI00391FA543
MKLAIIGSRNLTISNLQEHLPSDVEEIISGGAKGVDTSAKEYAIAHNLKLTEFLPNYAHYKRGAPLKRNLEIIDYADFVLIFWDGRSRGTQFVIQSCQKINKPYKLIKQP